jgi:hypothetical protein
MKEPLFLNTIEEAAAWLAEATGHAWTPKEVLNSVLLTYGVKPRKLLPDRTWFPKETKIKLTVAPPLDTKFGRYKLEHGKMIFQGSSGYHNMSLYMDHIAQLLALGETNVSMAWGLGDTRSRADDEMVCLVPLDSFVRVNPSMVRITGGELLRLRSTLPNMLKDAAQDPVDATTKKADAVPPQSDASRTASGSSTWVLKKPERVHVLTDIIYSILKAAYDAGQRCPTARDVIDDLRNNPQPDIVEVGRDEIKYLNDKRGTNTADLDAIRKRIERLTTQRTDAKRPLSGR